MHEKIPVSLYIHLPWCVQKCPYCDFNSHALKSNLPEELYVSALIHDWERQSQGLQGRPLTSIFFGGGTPSLFSAPAIERILNSIAKQVALPQEITLEANPGTIDQPRFAGYRKAGVNRLSLGVQSLQDDKLKILGRIHDSQQAARAMHAAREAGFDNINIDLMFGLPQQSLDDALHDLEKAVALEPRHLSWYQLTLEPNTLFHKQPPPLPADDAIWEMQTAGQQFLQTAGYQQYEVSAYAQTGRECLHNLNYWEFGDYIGIGAGAHGKITVANEANNTLSVLRRAQVKHPKDYLNAELRRTTQAKCVPADDLPFEFMLNALRLTKGVPTEYFSQRTGMPLQKIQSQLIAAQNRGLLALENNQLRPTAFGFKFLNDLMQMFL